MTSSIRECGSYHEVIKNHMQKCWFQHKNQIPLREHEISMSVDYYSVGSSIWLEILTDVKLTNESVDSTGVIIFVHHFFRVD